MTDAGTLLGGRYRLESVIGRGGMAEVWLAHDTRLGREVAVKRLRVDLASDPTFQARFRREAQSAAGLNHANIVSVYDTGEEADPASDVQIPYIVMELVKGHTLRDVLRDGRKILPERALEFTMQVLDALAYSHRAGIIHRDIKPANVMLTPQGTVKVMDFGIARAVADTSATMTQTAAVIGTAQYLSPEQARGETVDHRSDIYSCGCLLYELLVNRPPFVGDSPVSVAYQHVREMPVPPSQLDSEITPGMDAIVLKSLAKNADDRYPDARAMRDDIARLLAGEEVTAVLPPAMAASGDVAATQVLPAGGVPAPTTVAPVGYGSPASASTGSMGAADTGSWPTQGQTAVEEAEEHRRNPWLVALLVGLVLAVLAGVGYGTWTVLRPEPKPTVAMTTVPMVRGLNQEAATSSIINNKLKVGKVTQVNGPEESKGTVIKQEPAGQTSVPEGTAVDLVINVGVKTATVPDDLVGKTEEQVTAALKAAGFKVKREDAAVGSEPEGYQKGQVTKVDPSSGAELPVGSEVTITVATGRTTVPTGLVGLPLKEAEAKLKAAGFKVKTTDADPANEPRDRKKGDVVEVTPPEGEAAEQGTEVTLVIATGLSPAPNLVGMTQQGAESAAQQAGFAGVEVEVKEVDQGADGTVIDQGAKAGELAERAKPIKIVIAKVKATEPATTAPPTDPTTTDPTVTQPSGEQSATKPGKGPKPKP